MLLPTSDCYEIDGRLLAGAYPGSDIPEVAAQRIRRFELYGVTHFVDLTHPADPLEPYDPHLRTSTRHAEPIVDMGIPTVPQMERILDHIDAVRAERGVVYVHCWGGLGRTGTVVGCWLVRHGADGGDPLAELTRLRRRALRPPLAASPQVAPQCAFVTSWRQGQ